MLDACSLKLLMEALKDTTSSKSTVAVTTCGGAGIVTEGKQLVSEGMTCPHYRLIRKRIKGKHQKLRDMLMEALNDTTTSSKSTVAVTTWACTRGQHDTVMGRD